MRKLLAFSWAVWSLYSYADPARVSVNSSGIAANDASTLNFSPTDNTLFNVSADGRFIVYDSNARNLVEGDINSGLHVFVHDQQTGVTGRISVASDGTRANGASFAPSFSADGRYVAFESSASNLIEDGLNRTVKAIFLYDRQTGKTVPVSNLKANDDSQTPIISADGQFVLFSNREGAHLYDVATATTQSLPIQGSNLALSASGRFIASGYLGAFLDRETGIVTQIAEVDSTRLSISTDGRYTVFSAADTDKLPCNGNQKVDTFIYDSKQKQITCISQLANGIMGNGDSFALGIVAGDRRVAFVSDASNLIAGDTNAQADLFFYDIQTGLLTGHEAPPLLPNRVSISADGHTIAYNHIQDGQIYSQTVSELPAFTVTNAVISTHESPTRGSQESGLGLIRGWHCTAKQIQFQMDDQNKQTLISGLSRGDTRSVCGDADNGYSILVNYNLIGAGEHTIRLYADDILFAEEPFSVVSFGQEFIQGLRRVVTVSDFPVTSHSVQLSWSESLQNFVLTASSDTNQIVTPQIRQSLPVNKSAAEVIQQASGLTDPFTGEILQIEVIASSSSQSEDRRWHVFVTDVDGLIAEDDNGLSDLFLYDEQLRQLRRLSPETSFQGRVLALTASDNGQWLAFSTEDSVWLYDIEKAKVSRVLPQSVSFDPWAKIGSKIEKVNLSASGRYVAYYLRATRHEFRGDGRIAYANLFVYDFHRGALAAVLPSTEMTVIESEREARIGTRFGFSDDETALLYRIKPAGGQNPSPELKALSLEQLFLNTEDHRSVFETHSDASGLGLIRGWVCDAQTIFMQIDDQPWVEIAYAMDRGDTQSVCGDTNNGYTYLMNWNLLGAGQHRIQIYADGYRVGDRLFTVTTLGQEFISGISRSVSVNSFPFAGDRTTLKWSEPHQNFVIVDYSEKGQSIGNPK